MSIKLIKLFLLLILVCNSCWAATGFDAHPYSSAGDGSVTASSARGWDSAHDATSGTADYTSTTAKVQSAINNAESTATIGRGFLAFDLSSTPTYATILNAELNLYVTAKSDNDDDGDDFMVVVLGKQASPTSLIGDDYDDCGDKVDDPTEGSERIDIGSIRIEDYARLSINSIGKSWVKDALGGWLKLGVREGHDVIDESVVGLMAIAENSITFVTSEEEGTAQDPYIIFTYVVPQVVKVYKVKIYAQ